MKTFYKLGGRPATPMTDVLATRLMLFQLVFLCSYYKIIHSVLNVLFIVYVIPYSARVIISALRKSFLGSDKAIIHSVGFL